MRVDRMDKLIQRFWPEAVWERAPVFGGWASIRLPRAQDGVVFRLAFCQLTDAAQTDVAIGDGIGRTRRFEYVQDALAELLYVSRHLHHVPHPDGSNLTVAANIRHIGQALEPLGLVVITRESPPNENGSEIVERYDMRADADLAMIRAFITDETAVMPLVDYFMGVEG